MSKREGPEMLRIRKWSFKARFVSEKMKEKVSQEERMKWAEIPSGDVPLMFR